MQIENRYTITQEQLESEEYPLELACNPLGKLEFIAGTIKSLCSYGEDTIEINNPLSMADIIADATFELWSVVNAGIDQIDSLKKTIRDFQAGKGGAE